MEQYSGSASTSFGHMEQAEAPMDIVFPFERGPAEPSDVENWHHLKDVAAERMDGVGAVEDSALSGMNMLLHAEMTEAERRKIRDALTIYVRQKFPDQAMADQAQILLDSMMNDTDDPENGN